MPSHSQHQPSPSHTAPPSVFKEPPAIPTPALPVVSSPPPVHTGTSSSPDDAIILPALSPPANHVQYQDLLRRMAMALSLPVEDVQDPQALTAFLDILQPPDSHVLPSLSMMPSCNWSRLFGTLQPPVPLHQSGQNTNTSCPPRAGTFFSPTCSPTRWWSKPRPSTPASTTCSPHPLTGPPRSWTSCAARFTPLLASSSALPATRPSWPSMTSFHAPTLWISRPSFSKRNSRTSNIS